MGTVAAQTIAKNSTFTVHKNFCLFEPIVPRIGTIRVVTVDSLVGALSHYSDVARSTPGFDGEKWLKLERKIAGLALGNIESNIQQLVLQPEIKRVHFSELSEQLLHDYQAEAIILSGTLRDFDFYEPWLFEKFATFVRQTKIPVLGICGGHQMIGQAFGADILTLDKKLPHERRANRQVEYQYKFVTIVDEADPIFHGINAKPEFDRWHKHSKVLRVWQNHGLQLARLPAGFKQLARGYLAEQQMMVRRTAEQLIYSVQFHIEKSFQDFQLDNYWNHRIESRDGRMIFENFMIEALRFMGQDDAQIFPEQTVNSERKKSNQLTNNNSDGSNLSGW